MTEPPPEPPPEQPPAPTVGPLALEAALLLDVVADRLTSIKDGASSARPTAAGAGSEQQNAVGATASSAGRCPECGSVPGASCTACPLCRFMALLRGEQPEATARLVDGALMIIRTLRSLVPDPPDASQPAADPSRSGSAQQGPPHPGPGQSGAGQQHPPHANPGRRGGLEHIDIL